MHIPDHAELAGLSRAWCEGNVSLEDMVDALHRLGHGQYEEAVPCILPLLKHPDAEVRCMALQTLTLGFHLEECWEVARQFLERDPDLDCQTMGAYALSSLRRDTADPETLQILARVVADPRQPDGARSAAYAAMRGVIHDDFHEQIALATRPLNLDEDVDWAMVQSYLSGDWPDATG